MASSYRGLYLIGDQATGRVTDVQVVDPEVNSVPLPLAQYINRGVDPPYKTLPWREDIERATLKR